VKVRWLGVIGRFLHFRIFEFSLTQPRFRSSSQEAVRQHTLHASIRIDLSDPDPAEYHLSGTTIREHTWNEVMSLKELSDTAAEDQPIPFAYQSLKHGYIRILQLQPGNKEDALEGHLTVADINDISIIYDALSYMWGDPTPTDTVYLSGKAFPIADNLAAALYHLRYQEEPLLIWVDAICIDQNDFAERSTQVQLMRQIYKRASTVRIWINEPSVNENADAVTALQNFDEHYDKDDLSKALGENPKFWEPIMPIFASPYWNRVWIQQEVLNASQLVLHCMYIIFPGTSIDRFWSASWSRYYAATQLNTASNIAWVDFLHPAWQNVSPATLKCQMSKQFLTDLLWTSKSLVMSDPRDRVYALMHLAIDYEDGGITVDYTKTVADVAMDAVVYTIGQHRNLAFLLDSYLDLTDGNTLRETHACYPSWLPWNWSGRTMFTNRVHEPETCTLRTLCSPNPIDIGHRRLRIRGFRVDTVRKVLDHGVGPDFPTAKQFCDSLLGVYLQVFAGVAMANLTQEMSSVLTGTRNHEYLETLKNLLKNCGDSLSLEDAMIEPPELALHEAVKSGLANLFRLANDGQYTDKLLNRYTLLDRTQFGELDHTDRAALSTITGKLTSRFIIVTETRQLGAIPRCMVQDGDEIWIALGCPLPIIIKPQSNGAYRYVCAADTPGLQEHADLRNLRSDLQVGDVVGEWTVGDIELE
jgi:hypothetical protein